MWKLLEKISIHPLFWIVVGIGVITGRFRELVILFIIIFIHEMGHAGAAHFFKWRIKKIQLLPFGGVAEVDEHGNRPLKEELIVILAGPLQHIWLMGAAVLLHQINVIDSGTYQLFMTHNITILLFNLLPIWPLDGAKLIFLGMSSRFSFSKAHKVTLQISGGLIGVISAVAVVLFPLQLSLWIVLSFVIFSVLMEWRQRKYTYIRFLLERYYGKNQSIKTLKPIVVDESVPILEVMSKFSRGCKHQIVIKFSDDQQMTLDENELLHAYFTEKRTTCTIGEVLG